MPNKAISHIQDVYKRQADGRCDDIKGAGGLLLVHKILQKAKISHYADSIAYFRPLGMTVSTVLTLILVPVLYCSFAGTGIKRNRKKMKAARELNDYYQAHKTEMTKGKKE